jgi:hypothetical protein
MADIAALDRGERLVNPEGLRLARSAPAAGLFAVISLAGRPGAVFGAVLMVNGRWGRQFAARHQPSRTW